MKATQTLYCWKIWSTNTQTYCTPRADPFVHEYPFDYEWSTASEAVEGLRDWDALEEAKDDKWVLVKVTYSSLFQSLGEFKMKETMIHEFVTNACVHAVAGNGYDLADVCEISDKILHIMHPDMNHLQEDEDGCGSYPAKSQALYNKYFDEVESALTEIGLCYDITKSTWIVKPRKETVAVQIPFPLGDRDVFVYEVPENGATIEQALENFKSQADEDYSIDDLEAYFEKQGFVVAQVTRLEGEY